MFGYVRIFKPELKVSEYEHYQGIYCSLCKQLGKRYGFFSRLTLSYDFTFLAIFHMALDDECAGFKKDRCAFNPLKKRMCCCQNRHIDFAADVASILIYYKIKDNINDKGFLSSLPARFLLPFAYHARRRAARRIEWVDKIVTQSIGQQADIESSDTASVDSAAHPTAHILSHLAQHGARDEREQRIRERFGYCLGRWIYLIDAADDIKEDILKGNFNPFKSLEDDISQAVLPMLNACLAECKAAYNLLEIKRFDGIIRNILELGMPAAGQQVLNNKKGNKDGKRSV
ncbi:MAG: DUF5685 family protein [Oscillospiraceae bacterium]|nr:DUF5685 family protein [Oscillospiraceae bacterium]